VWHVEGTRRLIEQRFGFAQLSLARPALKSALDRQEHVRYHYRELNGLINEFHRDHLQDSESILFVTLNEESWNAYNEFLIKTSAHIVAMIQALHSVPDLFAHALYFSLDLNHKHGLHQDKISALAVAELLQRKASTASLGEMLRDLRAADTAKHVAALANSAKHRSIIEATISEDLTGTRAKRQELQFSQFNYRKKTFPAIAVTDILEKEYERVNRLTVNMGKVLQELLEKVSERADR